MKIPFWNRDNVNKFKNEEIYIYIGEGKVVLGNISNYKFLSNISNVPPEILILKGNLPIGKWNSSLCLYESSYKEIIEYLNSSVDIGKEFCWVDYNTMSNSHNIGREKIAKLWYAAHFYEFYDDLFWDNLESNFFYMADYYGKWIEVFMKNTEKGIEIMINILKQAIKMKTRTKNVIEFDENIIQLLRNYAGKGLIIDYKNIKKEKSIVKIKIYFLEKRIGYDEYINILETNYLANIKGGILEYREGNWNII